jgi:hypothetical protein
VIVPVDIVHVGCITLKLGAAGAPGTSLITTAADATEEHPCVLVTVKPYVPAERPVIVVVVVFPVIAPGLIVQFPEGNPLSTTDPVDIAQVGCVMIPAMGAAGVAGCTLITTLADAVDVHPAALVTVKLYVPGARPLIVVVAVLPGIAPGLIVQLPAGRLLKSTLPIAVVQVGCIIVPGAGAVTGGGSVIETADAVAEQRGVFTSLAVMV